MKSFILVQLVISSVLVVISGCATLPRNPVPIDRIHEAQVVQAPDMRAFAGAISPIFQDDFVRSLHQEDTGDFINPETGHKRYSALALSGGGSHGAFGAGFLYGWSKKGDRPSFKLVTGISTGALIAPFAFLGSSHDEQLRQVYTTVDTESIIKKLSLFRILTESESFTSSGPLQRLIRGNIDRNLLKDISRVHQEGRRLYIGTTHMDAQQLVVWNMGLIAELDTPEALELFQNILLASASIPTAMPPVFFSVEVDGEVYDEMHTDGGTITQVFFHGGTMDLGRAGEEAGIQIENGAIGTLYVIRNGELDATPEQVPRNIKEISSKAMDTMIKTAALNNLFRMYVFAERDKSELLYVDIPRDFVSKAKEPFDVEEMNKLFDIGMKMGMSHDPWSRTIPVAAEN